MEVSSTCMNVPKARAAAVTALRPPTRPCARTSDGGICAHEPAATSVEFAIGAGLSLGLSRAGSCALGPALSAMISAIRAPTVGSLPALCCVGCGTLRTAMVMRGPEVSCRSTRTVLDSPTRSGCALSSLGPGECAAAGAARS